MKRIGNSYWGVGAERRYGFRAGQHLKLKYYHEHGDQ